MIIFLGKKDFLGLIFLLKLALLTFTAQLILTYFNYNTLKTSTSLRVNNIQ